MHQFKKYFYAVYDIRNIEFVPGVRAQAAQLRYAEKEQNWEKKI